MNQPDPQPHLVLRQSSLASGTMIGGRYQILRVLGTGGMGSVYLAQNTSIGQKVAIKVLESQFFHQPMQVQRFMREARTICKIHHENVIYLSDFGYTDDQIPFIVMEYLEGEDLLHTLKREGTLSWPQTFSIMRQICAGLEAAHSCGVIHRDLKPSNCFRITRTGQEDWIKLIDFGIAKLRDDSHSGLTQTGVLIGTPTYMSPEQARSDELDLRSDLYSAALILYRMLCGRLPFEGERAIEIVLKHVTMPPPSLTEAAPHRHFHPRLEMEMTKALAKSPEERFQSAKEFFAKLVEVDEYAKKQNRPVVADKSSVEVTSPEVGKVEEHSNRRSGRLRIVSFFSGLGIMGVAALSLWWTKASHENMRISRDLFQEEFVKPLIYSASTNRSESQQLAIGVTGVELEQEDNPPQPFSESAKDLLLSTESPPGTTPQHPHEAVQNKEASKHSRKASKNSVPQRSQRSLRKILQGIEGHVQACLAQGGFPGQSVSVEIMVAENGKLQQAKVLGPLAGSALEVCVRKAVSKAKFPRGEGTDMVVFQFTL